MSITDELRGYALLFKGSATHARLDLIADRIDKTLEDYIELPKDADGEYIRVGERVQRIGNDPSTVSHMSLADDGWRVFVKYDGSLGTGSGRPEYIRHVQPDSWECIIEDAMEAYQFDDGSSEPSIGSLVERCKRLAGGGA